MSTPIPPAPPPPIEPTAAVGRGWGRKVLIGCGVAALVVAACFLGLILYVRQRPETVTDIVMKQVESHYAPDVTAQEKEDLRTAYAEFRAALRARRVSREPLERIRATFVMGGQQNEISRDQVRELTALFRQAAGTATPSPPAAEPSPSPGHSP